MLITATIILGGLSADVKRQSFLESYQNEAPHYIEYVSDSQYLNNNYYLDSIEDSKKRNLIKELDIEGFSNKVKTNAIEMIGRLSALFVMNFDLDNLYKSSYGTLILEYEKNGSNFTIDVGENSFGYFSEINGNIQHINEESYLSSNSSNDDVLGQLNKDFVDFYYSV